MRRLGLRIQLLLAFAAWLVPLLAFSQDVRDRAGEVSWEVRHALGGIHTTGAFIPLHIVLRNDGADDLTVRLESDSGGRLAGRTVELPSRSNKSLTFYVGPMREQGSADVQLLAEKGEPLLEAKLASVRPEPGTPIVGIVGGHSLGWSSLHASKQVQIAHLKIDELPGRHVGLRALDLLVWPDANLGELRPEQIDAVRHWTSTGGILVLPVNDSWLSASVGGLEPWTSIRPLGIVSRHSMPSLAQFSGQAEFGPLPSPISIARLSKEVGEVWVEESFGATAVTEARDRGMVLVVGWDPSEDPVGQWTGLEQFWKLALQSRGLELYQVPEEEEILIDVYRYGSERSQLESLASEELTSISGIKPPSISLLILVLLAYLLMIGPVDYLVLRKLKKLEWTWITYPAIVLVFALGTWAVANRSKSGDPLLHELRIHDLYATSGIWVEEAQASFFATRSADYELSDKNGSSLPVLPRSAHRYSGHFAALATVPRADQGSAAVSARLPKWSVLRGGFLDTLPANGARLDATLQFSTSTLSGELRPHLGFDLDRATLLILNGANVAHVDLGRLRDATPMTITPSTAASLLNVRKFPQGMDFLTQLQYVSARSAVAGPQPENPTDHYWWSQFLRDDAPHHDWSGWLENGGALLIGEMKVDPSQSRFQVTGSEFSAQPIRRFVRIPIHSSRIDRTDR